MLVSHATVTAGGAPAAAISYADSMGTVFLYTDFQQVLLCHFYCFCSASLANPLLLLPMLQEPSLLSKH
jgi:hypothetical protein